MPQPQRGDSRVPPHNLAAEASLLGAALLYRDAANGIPDPRQFYKPVNQHVAHAIRQLVAADDLVDAVSVSEQLRHDGLLDDIGGLEYLLELTNTNPSLSAWNRYYTIVKNTWTMREMLGTASAIADIAYNEPDDVAGALTRVRERFEAVEVDPGHSTLQIPDLAELFRVGLKAETTSLLRRTDDRCLLYMGKAHSITAESTTGKSWAALLAALQVLVDGGSVIYLDYEDNVVSIMKRLVTIGADPKAVAERFLYIKPEGPLGAAEKAKLAAQIEDLNPDLIVIDAFVGALSMEGLSENEASDIEKWTQTVGKWLIAQSGAALLILDHVIKDTEARGRYARGSGRKLEWIDGVVYQMKLVKGYSMNRAGSANLICAKDRGGNFSVGEVAAVVSFDPAAAGELLKIELRPYTADLSTHDEWAPTTIMAKISRAIIESQTPLTGTSLKALFSSTKKALIEQAIARLLKDGFIRESSGGRGRSKTFRSLRPFAADGVHGDSSEPGLFDVEPPVPHLDDELHNVIRGPWADRSYVPPDE